MRHGFGDSVKRKVCDGDSTDCQYEEFGGKCNSLLSFVTFLGVILKGERVE